MWSYVIEQTNRSLMLMGSLGVSLGKHYAGHKNGAFFFFFFFSEMCEKPTRNAKRIIA